MPEVNQRGDSYLNKSCKPQYGTEIIFLKLLHTNLRVTLILDIVLSHFLMNEIIEPIEIGRINSRYNKIKISEFDMVLPQRRVEGLTLYLAESVNRSFRAPTRAGIVGDEFVDVLTRGRCEAVNVTQYVVANAGRLVNASDDGIIRAQKVVVVRFIYRGSARAQPRGLISIRERIVLSIGKLIMLDSFSVNVLLVVDFFHILFHDVIPLIFDFRLAPIG